MVKTTIRIRHKTLNPLTGIYSAEKQTITSAGINAWSRANPLELIIETEVLKRETVK